jgi:hypothetical protein
MATKTVTFTRTWSGIAVNCWIYHPDHTTEKLVFTNDQASSSLAVGADYTFFWIAVGQAGSALDIDYQVQGGASKSLVSKWKIPAGPGDPPGKIITYQDLKHFSI